ncbi:MAG: glycerate kinase, partial [Bacteroidota bacterium]
MRILIAPDKFKLTLTAMQVAEITGNILREHGHEVLLCPLADGGEGTFELLTQACNGSIHQVAVSDPLGRGTLGKINKSQRIICNGFKKDEYVKRIFDLHADGYKDIISVIDNKYEFQTFEELVQEPMNIGIRIASEEEP